MLYSAELMKGARSLHITQSNPFSNARAQLHQLLLKNISFAATRTCADALEAAQLVSSFAQHAGCKPMVSSLSAAALVHRTSISLCRENVLALPQTQRLWTNSTVSADFSRHFFLHCSFQPVVVRLAAVGPGACKELAQLRRPTPALVTIVKKVRISSFPKLTVVPPHHETAAAARRPSHGEVGPQVSEQHSERVGRQRAHRRHPPLVHAGQHVVVQRKDLRQLCFRDAIFGQRDERQCSTHQLGPMLRLLRFENLDDQSTHGGGVDKQRAVRIFVVGREVLMRRPLAEANR